MFASHRNHKKIFQNSNYKESRVNEKKCFGKLIVYKENVRFETRKSVCISNCKSIFCFSKTNANRSECMNHWQVQGSVKALITKTLFNKMYCWLLCKIPNIKRFLKHTSMNNFCNALLILFFVWEINILKMALSFVLINERINLKHISMLMNNALA